MSSNGINAVRLYVPPPRWLLDMAWQHGLFIFVGLPWEQHVAFLENRRTTRNIEDRLRRMIRPIAGHPALLGYAIGNEIPAPIVRWHGPEPVEGFIRRLYNAAKEEDPGGLVTYVNYPSTEYLQLPFLDFYCYNVYLEDENRLEAYLYRLHNLAGDRPLLMGEIGLDSRRNGEKRQAETLERQIGTVFRSGCAGVFVFSWTDEWHRGGYYIEDWDFGLTRRDRFPKPALASVRKSFSETPFRSDTVWPRVSVVVCSYNGAYTIRDCFEGLRKLDYPDFEVIVVNDGSTDRTGAIAKEYGFQVITTNNQGLSAARNRGMEAATGDIVAYIDDDAYPDPHWLKYIALTFLSTDCTGVGGPNIPPHGDGAMADCVANAPGGPLHVLFSDREAEHIPGCNMAFRKKRLKAVGGFDARFRTAGDDVDLCWRIQGRKWWLAFNPAAVVWHHRRNSFKAYWRQQKGYGKAEALLQQKWPEKYNSFGHLTWAGHIYGRGFTKWFSWHKWRIYHGSWCRAPFQSIYERKAGLLESLPLMPEWYMVNLVLLLLSMLGLAWKPMLFALSLLALTAGIPFLYVVKTAAGASFSGEPLPLFKRWKLKALTTFLHMVQPLARLLGRLRHGLTPWRFRNGHAFAFPRRRKCLVWREQWRALHDMLEAIETYLKKHNIILRRGGDFDRWDLEIHGGLLGRVQLTAVVEEHGGGRQLIRYILKPRCTWSGIALIAFFGTLAIGAGMDRAWMASAFCFAASLLLALRIFMECGGATAALLSGIERTNGDRS